MDGVVIELNKLERQIILYQYLNSPVIKGKLDQEELYGIPVSTIYKDMRDLRDAGLIHIKWKSGLNSEEGQYVTVYQEDEDNTKIKPYDEAKDSPARVRHLHRLKRICQALTKLRNDELQVDYTAGKLLKGKTCKQYYKELFPGISERTMQRDFQTLTRVGFPIRYNRTLQYYEFFEVVDEDYPWVDGVSYDPVEKKLKRLVSDRTDCEIQPTHMDEILDIREGLYRD